MIIDLGNTIVQQMNALGDKISHLDGSLLDMETKLQADLAELLADRDALIRNRREAHQTELDGIGSEYNAMIRIINDMIERIATARGRTEAQEYREAAE